MCEVVALARRRTVAAVLHQWKLWNFSAHPRFGQVSLHASIIISTASQRQTLGPTDRQLLETLFGGWWETIENDLPIHECVDYFTWTSSNTIYQTNIKKVLSNSKTNIFHRQSPNIYLSNLLSLLRPPYHVQVWTSQASIISLLSDHFDRQMSRIVREKQMGMKLSRNLLCAIY